MVLLQAFDFVFLLSLYDLVLPPADPVNLPIVLYDNRDDCHACRQPTTVARRCGVRCNQVANTLLSGLLDMEKQIDTSCRTGNPCASSTTLIMPSASEYYHVLW
jgi:hypothetical protein